MEGPLETFETPKQDKMISLIAWLIIACLLFYLAVFTFESFLRKSPWFAVTQEISGSEQFEASTAQEVAIGQNTQAEDSVVEEVNAFATLDAEPVSNFGNVPKIEDENVSSGNGSSFDEASLGEEISFSKDVSAVSDLRSETSKDSTPVAAKIVEELVSNVSMFQLKLENTFTSRSQTFQFLKEMDFGDLEISLEIVSKNGLIHVLVGGLKGQEESGRIEKYLKARNHGLRLISISETAGELFFQGPTAPAVASDQKAKDLGTASDKNFELESRFKPYTIQIGSFLTRRNAVVLQEKMEEKGFSSAVEDKLQGNTYHYRVLVGNFSTRDEATSQATKLSESDDVPVYVRTFK